jgi:hypothetical protein
MKSRLAPSAIVLILAAPASAADLDFAGDFRLFDTHFARYGPGAAKSLGRESLGARFRLPAAAKKDQVGWYSYFALAGDFEVAADYSWISVSSPTAGYGVTCGVAVDSQVTGESVSLARGHLMGKGGGYVVTVGRPGEGGTKYETTHYPTQTKNGRLAMRREQAELVCLAADGPKEPLRELTRVAFTEGTVRPVRLFADRGGSPTALDAWLGRLHVKAAEIAGGAPRTEAGDGIGWWPAAAAVPVVAAAGLLLARRRKRCEA